MADSLTSFVNVKLSITPEGGTKTTTQCMFDLSGLGSSRSVDKKKCLNDKTLIAVGMKEYETLNFSLPYSETSGDFHEVAVGEYDANNMVAIEVEFDNMPNLGTNGTLINGNAYVTSYKPGNDSNSIVSSFTVDWDGEPVITKAV